MAKKKKQPQAAVPVQTASVPVDKSKKAQSALNVKPASQPVAEEALLPAGLSKKEKVTLILFFALVMLSMVVTVGRVTMVCMLLFLLLAIRKSSFSNLKQHFSLPVIGFVLMALIYGAAGMYSPFGESAILEFFRGFCYFSLAGFVLLRFHKKMVPGLLWGIVIVCGIFSFLSVDMAATQWVFNPVATLAEWIGADMRSFDYVNGDRIAGIFNNSNVLAGMTAMAMLIGLYHVQTEEKPKTRFLVMFLLGINAVAFWLCVSRGAILCFGLSLILYVVLSEKKDRLPMTLLMALCVVVTIAVCQVATPVLGTGSVLPDLAALACGPAIFLLYQLLVKPVIRLLDGREKLMMVGGIVMAGLAVVAIGAALTLRGPVTLTEDDWLIRQVKLEAGKDYTMSGDWDGDPTVAIYVEREKDLLLDNYETIYFGPASEVAFTLPEDTVVTNVQFRGSEQVVREVVFSDGTKLQLDYLLLPNSIEDRLSDSLLTSSSTLLRVQYVKDALKIWMTSPLIGRGLTSTDNLYASVQPIFYQSRFAHNHLAQYLADVGLVGFSAFLMIVVGLAWLLLKKWKQNREPLAIVFLACLFMMNLHSFIEFNFSIRAYGIIAYLLLAIMVLAYGEPMFMKDKKAIQKWSNCTAAGLLAVIAVFFVVAFSYRVVIHKATAFETTSLEDYLDTMDDYIAFDAFNDDYYKIMYVAQGGASPRHIPNVHKYAQELRASGTYTNCDGAARYYYLPLKDFENFFACYKEGISQKAADPRAWNIAFDFFRSTAFEFLANDWDNVSRDYIEGVLGVRDYMLEFSAGQLDGIQLSDENQAYINALEQIWKDPEMTPEVSKLILQEFSFAESEAN